MRWGIRAVIGESFAEIFYGNCLAIGIPCFTLSKELIKQIQNDNNQDKCLFKINIKESTLKYRSVNLNLKIKNSSKQMFLSGEWDATSTLLANINYIEKKFDEIPYIKFNKSLN